MTDRSIIKKGKRQIDKNSIYRASENLVIPQNRSTHYTSKVDKQIKIPLPGFDIFYNSLNNSDEIQDEGQTLIRKPRM